MAGRSDLVTIGKIVKPVGIKGDVRVVSLSDVPGRFETLREVMVVSREGSELATTVERVREDRGWYVVHMAAFSTPEQAAAFRGAWLKIPQDHTPSLPEGRFYEFQLIGLEVRDESNAPLGTLEEIFDTGAHSICVVRENGREVLIPVTHEAIASVDLAGRLMIVRRRALVEDPDAV